jgi:hypothetical protein
MTIDCIACLVALARGRPSNGTHTGVDGVTHATYLHESYGAWQALTCSFRGDGWLRLVPR